MPSNDQILRDKIGKTIKSVPRPEDARTGMDTRNVFFDTLINAMDASAVDISKFESFSQISNNRETLYQVLDAMGEDPIISAALEIYVEDTTAKNTEGKIVWVKSDNDEARKYVTYLLDALRVDHKMYKWAYALIKYGDLYVRLFRQSDFEGDLFEDEDDHKKQLNEAYQNLLHETDSVLESLESGQTNLDESVMVRAYGTSDGLANYVEAVANPGEMFELTKFGKSYAYIKTNTIPTEKYNDPVLNQQNIANTFKFKKQEVDIFNATNFVHAALEDNVTRSPEQIQLFNVDESDVGTEETLSYTYNVRRGESILYDVYKIWRQIMLLENALLLNRLTKSSILRIVQVEVADMPKERVGPHLQRIKNLVEQKSAIDTGTNIQEYTNPGAMENNIYVPTHNGIGAITTDQIGGDVNVRDIADIDYFKNKFYGALKIPKQYLGDTDDATGFNGGTSLSIISSRYCKTVKRIQQVLCDMVTDIVNIFLLDRGLENYIGEFELAITPPVSQEELDARDAKQAELAMAGDVINMIADLVPPTEVLKITTTLLGDIISNEDVIDILNEVIDNPEAMSAEGDDMDLGGLGGGMPGGGSEFNFDLDGPGDMGPGGMDEMGPEPDSGGLGEGGSTLPSPADLGVDLTAI